MRRVVCVCISVSFAILLSGCGTTKQAYLSKGNAFFAEAKYDAATLSYRNAIQKDPAYGEAYYRLGLTAAKLDQAVLAYTALEHAAQLMPENFEAKEKFAGVCLSFYLANSSHPRALYTRLTELSNQLLAQKVNSYEGWLVKGYLASTDRKPAEAIEYFRKALKIDSSNPGVVTELAKLLIQEGQVPEGEGLALKLISDKTSYGPVYDLMYGSYLQSKRIPQAENILNLKVKNNPKQPAYLVQLARHYADVQQDLAGSRRVLQQMIDQPANYPNARLVAGDFYLERHDYAQASHYLEEGLSGNPEPKIKLAYQKRCVTALLNQGKREAAAQLAAQVVKENPTDPEGLRLHAGILLESGLRADAAVAVKELETLAHQDPNDAALQLQLGRAYRLQSDLSAARTHVTAALAKQPRSTAAVYELAEISLLQQRPKEALNQTATILETNPRDRRARLLRTAGLIGTGATALARAELAQLIKESPTDVELQIQLGLLALAQNQYAEAASILSKHVGRTDPRVNASLAVAYLHQKQFDKARIILDEGLKSMPDSTILLERLAETEALDGHYDLAVGYQQKLIVADPQSPQLRSRLGEIYGLKGDHANEIACYRQALNLAPNDIAPSVNLAEALARAGRVDEARAQFDLVVKSHPDNGPALNNAAYFLAESGGDLDKALHLAQRALEKSPGQPVFSDTVGYIYLKKGLHDSAVKTFSNLARKYPTDPAFRYHLGLALYVKGDGAGARKELQAALSDHPTPDDQLRIRELLQKISGNRG